MAANTTTKNIVSRNGIAMMMTASDGDMPPMASMVQYMLDEPLWKAWSVLPNYVVSGKEGRIPFDAANGGMSTQDYYSNPANAESLQHANAFVKFVSHCEVQACVDGYDWQSLNHKTVVDLGGFSGKVLEAVHAKYPLVKCICLDLPEVVEKVAQQQQQQRYNITDNILLVGGDMFDPTTIPSPCDAIFMKHIILCEFDEEQSLEILASCHAVLPPKGRVIIGETVLPDLVGKSNQLSFQMEYFMLLDGRASSYTAFQWGRLAEKAGFVVASITETSIPTCSMIVLEKQ